MTTEVGSTMPAAEPASEDGPAAGRNHWVLIAVLALIYTCAFVDRQVLSLLVEPIKADLRISDVQMSLLLGLAFSLFYGILNIPAGHFVDRTGRRGLIAVAAILWSAMTIACGLAASFVQLFLARAGVGVAEAFITPASFSLIRDRVPPARRARAFSVLGMAPYFGSAAALSGGAALTAMAERGSFADWPVLSALHPWQVAMVVIGAAGAPLCLLLLLIAPDRRAIPVATHGAMRSGFGDAWRHIRAHSGVYGWLIAYVMLGAAIAFGKIAWTPAMMARKFHLPLAEIGYVLGPLYLVSGVAGLFTSGWVVDRVTARNGNIVRVAAVIMAGSMVFSMLPQLMPTATLAWIFFGIGNLFSGSFYSVGATMLARATPKPLMGKITAIYLFFQGVVGSAIGPMVVALISAAFFSGDQALANALTLYFLVAGLLGLGVLLFLDRGHRRAAPTVGDD